ncbi:MAG TPA: GNAT family N-acetyltransferase [Streptosporangiaceae bacterium]|jgi:GNAT superfamily N-acetyltransferase
MSEGLATRVATPETWADVDELLGPSGIGGCWCLFWRLPGPEFKAGTGDGNRERLRELVTAGAEPAVVAYEGGRPVGWVAVAPREEHRRLERSPLRAGLADGAGVWTVSCFYLAREARGRGVPATLLDAAVAHAARRGARAVEGFPKDTGTRISRAELYVGWPGLFTGAGFREVARPLPHRPIMRRDL